MSGFGSVPLLPKFLEDNLMSISLQLQPYFEKDVLMQSRDRMPSGSDDSGIEASRQASCSHSVVDDEIYKEIQQELASYRQIPYRNYVCDRCHKTGHMIQFCPTKDPSREPTPYQGDRRSVGHFTCNQCHRSWKSANTYANRLYSCNRCGASVYPHKMFPIK